MLTYLDLELMFLHRNAPGRFALVDADAKTWVGTDQTEAAGATDVALPQPAAGFCRFWLSLSANISTAVATDSVVLRIVEGLVTHHLVRLFPNSVNQVGLIGGGSYQSVAAGPLNKSMDPLLVTRREDLRITWSVTALSGQTTQARGRYLDLPC